MSENNFIVFSKGVHLKAPVEKVFAFHADPRNMEIVTPRIFKTQILQATSLPMEKGTSVTFKVSGFFVSVNWEIKIETFSRPELMVDLQVDGPFEYWKHYHIFQELDKGGTYMTDWIEYIPPAKKISGYPVSKVLEYVFKYRHEKTSKFFESI